MCNKVLSYEIKILAEGFEEKGIATVDWCNSSPGNSLTERNFIGLTERNFIGADLVLLHEALGNPGPSSIIFSEAVTPGGIKASKEVTHLILLSYILFPANL